MLIAAVQLNSGPSKAQNLEAAERWVRVAAARGAALIALPENFSWMGPEAERAGAAEPLDGPTLGLMAALAQELSVTLACGSILEGGAPGGRFFNTQVLLGPGGDRLAVYRKIHLFDVEVGDGATYRESAHVAPGSEVVVAQTAVGRAGLSICYDLRFPELYRAMADQKAELLLVPAAFTLMTGKDHWEVLLRARAIENQAYVVAAAQWGQHVGNRRTYGNALVCDPWGTVLARCPDGEGVAVAERDPKRQARIREELPCLDHRRLGRPG